MKKFIIISLIGLFMTFTGCSGIDNSKSDYDLEKFEDALKDKGYQFEIKDVQKDFLPTTKKRIIIKDEALDIYIFKNNKKMESEASNIDRGGCSYSGKNAADISWVSLPHFYKKGSLIVQYVGENETITSDLADILGEQFAGYN